MSRNRRKSKHASSRKSYVLEIVGTSERVLIPGGDASYEDALMSNSVYAAMRASAEEEAKSGTTIPLEALKRELDAEFGALPNLDALVIRLPKQTRQNLIKRASEAHLDPADLVIGYIERGLASGE